MKRMLAVAVVMVGVAIGITGCESSKAGGASFRVETGKPYVDYQDLRDRKLPDDGFSMTAYQLESDSTIDLRFYTHGKPGDKELIEPTLKKVKISYSEFEQGPPDTRYFCGWQSYAANKRPARRNRGSDPRGHPSRYSISVAINRVVEPRSLIFCREIDGRGSRPRRWDCRPVRTLDG